MANLALILFAPWFAIVCWLYWKYPGSHARTPQRRRFDLVAMALALVASAVAMRWGYAEPFNGVGAMWPQVLATLAAYHVFLGVLVVAWFVRGRWFRTG